MRVGNNNPATVSTGSFWLVLSSPLARLAANPFEAPCRPPVLNKAKEQVHAALSSGPFEMLAGAIGSPRA
jgi:hypothetical protein